MLSVLPGTISYKLCLNVSEMELLNCCMHVLDDSLEKLLLQLSMTTSTFQISFFKIFFWELFELNYFLNTNWIMPNVLKVMIKNVFCECVQEFIKSISTLMTIIYATPSLNLKKLFQWSGKLDFHYSTSFGHFWRLFPDISRLNS